MPSPILSYRSTILVWQQNVLNPSKLKRALEAPFLNDHYHKICDKWLEARSMQEKAMWTVGCS
jgi:hypothetical protein